MPWGPTPRGTSRPGRQGYFAATCTTYDLPPSSGRSETQMSHSLRDICRGAISEFCMRSILPRPWTGPSPEKSNDSMFLDYGYCSDPGGTYHRAGLQQIRRAPPAMAQGAHLRPPTVCPRSRSSKKQAQHEATRRQYVPHSYSFVSSALAVGWICSSRAPGKGSACWKSLCTR